MNEAYEQHMIKQGYAIMTLVTSEGRRTSVVEFFCDGKKVDIKDIRLPHFMDMTEGHLIGSLPCTYIHRYTTKVNDTKDMKDTENMKDVMVGVKRERS